MKKFLFVFALFLTFSAIAVNANAEKIMKDRDGNIHVAEVPIISSTEYKRTSFFFYTLVEKYKEGRLDLITKAGERYGEPTLAIHIICLVIAIVLVAISNIFFMKYKKFAVASAFAFAGVFAGASAFVFTSVVAGEVASMCAFVFMGIVASEILFMIMTTVKSANHTTLNKTLLIIPYISATIAILYDYI